MQSRVLPARRRVLSISDDSFDLFERHDEVGYYFDDRIYLPGRQRGGGQHDQDCTNKPFQAHAGKRDELFGRDGEDGLEYGLDIQ